VAAKLDEAAREDAAQARGITEDVAGLDDRSATPYGTWGATTCVT
jgi:hypothetical protein